MTTRVIRSSPVNTAPPELSPSGSALSRPSIELIVPSPTRLLQARGRRELWVKDDGKTCEVYGGNKPRKLRYLLEDAEKRRAKRLITIGAAGSHHVLATGMLGRVLGLNTTAISLPRPASYHAEQTIKQSILAGVDLISVRNPADFPRIIASLAQRDSYFIPPGGSNALGTLGYVDAIFELEAQVRAGELPEPDLIFVALGSGGTAAGLLAGLCLSNLHCQLVAVPILKLPFARRLVEALASSSIRLLGREMPADLSTRLVMDSRWIGAGYGETTCAAEAAITTGKSLGLALESTYTGKTFAAALEWLSGQADRGNVPPQKETSLQAFSPPSPIARRSLFWSTISTTSHSQTEERAVTLSPAIQALLRPPRAQLPESPPQRNA